MYLTPVKTIGDEEHLLVGLAGQNLGRRSGERLDVGLVGDERLVQATDVGHILAEREVTVHVQAGQNLRISTQQC
jgi:hypothetical protein